MSPITLNFIFALLALNGSIVHAFLWGSKAQDTMVSLDLHSSAVLDNHAIEAAVPELTIAESLQNALTIIQNANTLPSCHKAATASLVHDCATLDGVTPKDGDAVPPGSDLILHQSIKVYAARLAACELQEANSVPAACQAFVPTERTTKKRSMAGHMKDGKFSKPTELFLDYDDITERDTEKCVNALHSKPQWWTSYSNSKQNAVHICHAMRTELKKDESIRVYESLFEGAIDLDSQLRAMSEEHQNMQQQMQGSMQQLWVDLHQGNAEMQAEARRQWASMSEDYQQEFAKFQKDSADLAEIEREKSHQAAERLEFILAVAGDKFTQEMGVALAGQQATVADVNQYWAKFVMELVEHADAQRLLHADIEEANKLVQSTSELLREQRELSQSTLDTTKQAYEHLEKVNDSVGFLSSFLSWLSPTPIIGNLVYFCLSFGLLLHWNPSRIFGNFFIALGTTMAYSRLAGNVYRRISPLTGTINATVMRFGDDVTSSRRKTIGVLVLLLILFGSASCWYIVRKREKERQMELERQKELERLKELERQRGLQPYDPASPGSPKWTMPCTYPMHDARMVNQQWVAKGAVFQY